MFFNPFKKNLKKSDNQGFTMIEVLMALAIFSIGFMAIAAMQMASNCSNASARKATESITWAQDQVEALMSLPYDDAAFNAGGHAGPVEGRYTINWNATPPSNNTKIITVTVTWQEPEGQQNTSLSFIKAQGI